MLKIIENNMNNATIKINSVILNYSKTIKINKPIIYLLKCNVC